MMHDDPYRTLICAILARAVNDAQGKDLLNDYTDKSVLRAEAQAFLQDQERLAWFCDLIDIDSAYFLSHWARSYH